MFVQAFYLLGTVTNTWAHSGSKRTWPKEKLRLSQNSDAMPLSCDYEWLVCMEILMRNHLGTVMDSSIV